MKTEVWDAHMHLFGDLAQFPAVEGAAYLPEARSLDEYRAVMEPHGVNRSVLVQPSVYGVDNRFVLSMLAAHPDRLRGVVTLEAAIGEKQALRLRDAGVRGVRINLVQTGGGRPAPVLASLPALRSAGLHVQIVGRPANVLPVLEHLNDAGATAVLDHMMLLPLDDGDAHFLALRRRLESGNVYVKLSGLYRLQNGCPESVNVVSQMAGILLRDHGDRLVWGSDWPHPDYAGPIPAPERLTDVLSKDVPASVRDLVLVKTPRLLYT